MKQIFNPTRLATLVLLFSITLFISCEKELSSDPTEEATAANISSEADAESEIVFNEVFDNVMGVNNDVGLAGVGVFGQKATDQIGISARVDACPNVTVTHANTPDIFPVKIEMDFGTGCTGRDGRKRSGKIVSVYTNRLIIPGAKATTTFVDFKIDSIKVEGTHVITNLNIVTSQNFIHKWKVVVEGAKLTKPNGNYTEWNSTRTVTQIEGSGTIYLPLDDIYKIEGGGSGKVKRGDRLVLWKEEITEPLIKKFSCRWIVKGILKVVRQNLSTTSIYAATLNYGNGDCDKKAVITVNGVSREITLP
jgi:hypothetical protein